MKKSKKIYIVIEAWDDGNDENVRAAFTNQKDAKAYADSKQGNWYYYDIDLDVERPDNSMRVWSVEIDIDYPEIMRQHDVVFFIPKNGTFYMEQKGNKRCIIIFVEANRESKAFEQASEMYKKILGNPEKYKGYFDVHKRFYTNVGDLYDFATGNKIQEFRQNEYI